MTVNVRELHRGPGQWSQVCFLSYHRTLGVFPKTEKKKKGEGDRTERRGRSEDRQRWRG